MSYIRSKLGTVAAFAVFAGVFAAVALLCGVPLFVLWYAGAVCLAFGAVFITVDYLRFRKKRAVLDRLMDDITW